MSHRILGIKAIRDRLNKRNQNSEGHNPSAEIAAILSAWTPRKEDLDELWKLSRQSLDEVIHLTEYEDGKANRILAAMAFLSAFAAVVFGKTIDKISIADAVKFSELHTLVTSVGTTWVYFLFALFCIFVALGALYVIRAIRPQFTIPRTWEADAGKPGSFLFAFKIIEVTPKTWATAFAKTDADQLKLLYIKNCIHETYLVALKIQIKLIKLKRGVTLFEWSAAVLTFLLLLCVVLLVLVS